ncbi:MAG: GAF domain-containing protein [Nitrospirae bacterium]|nr:GAF domain-containing protein [Nitrospirota bacterium]
MERYATEREGYLLMKYRKSNTAPLEEDNKFVTWLQRLQNLCISSNKKSLEDILSVIAKGIGRFINAETSWACVIEGEKLEFFSVSGAQAKAVSENISLKNDICTWILENKRPLFIPACSADRDNSKNNKRIIRDLPKKIKIDSFIGAPMFCKKGILGMLFVINKKKGLFTKEDADSLSIFSTVISPFIDNIRLNAGQSQTQKEHEALQSIIDTTLTSQNLESMLYTLIQKVVQVMGVNAGEIYLLNEANKITLRTSYNIPEETLDQYYEKINDEVMKELFKKSESLVLYAEDEPLIKSQYVNSYQVRSILCMPLRNKNRVIGVLHIDTLSKYTFSPYEIKLLEILTERIALAIENKHLLDSLNEEIEISSILLQTAELISNHTTTDQLLKRIVHIIPWFINSDWCCTYLWNESKNAFIPAETSMTAKPLVSIFKKMILTSGIFHLADKILETRNSIIIEDAANSELIPKDYINAFNAKSVLIVPFVSRGYVMGFMNIIFAQAPHTFTTKEIAIAKGIANQVAVFLENMKLNEGIKESEERYRTLVENATDAITSIDLDGIVISWNKASEELYGYTKEEAMAKKIPVVPEDRASELPFFFENVIKGKMISNFETKRRHKNGNIIDVSITISPVTNENGEIIGFSGIARDISEKKHLEEKKIQLEKESAMIELAGAAAHEINQPLTSIMARADLLITEMPKEDPFFRSVKIISEESKRLAAIVRKIGQVTRYKTKPYVGEKTIIDIEGASKDDHK